MNSAAREWVSGDTFIGERIRTAIFSVRNVLLSVLISLLVVNAFAVIYVTDWNRRLFGELQALQQRHEELSVERGQLLLEQTTWAAQARVQQIARDQLDMTMPAPESMVMIRS